MKTIYVAKGDVVPGTNGGRPWMVDSGLTPGSVPLQVDDDVFAPIGAVWDGDYRSRRPSFLIDGKVCVEKKKRTRAKKKT